MAGDLIGPSYVAWTCACDGQLWLEKPRHVTCTNCGRLIRETPLVPRSTAAHYKHERDTANGAKP